MKKELKNMMTDRLKKIEALQNDLNEKINGYRDDLKSGKAHYGHAGDLGHIIEMLEELTGKRG